MSGKCSIWLVPLGLLLAATVARAVPTVENCKSNDVRCLLTPGSALRSTSRPDITPTDGSSDPQFSHIASEFYSPPVNFSPLHLPDGAKSLPPVPSALLMVLTGFLCVSLVKDRRVWVAVLASLLWAGHTGLNALPQLARHLTHSNHNKRHLCSNLVYSFRLESFDRLRSEIEGTKYIGLLHHIAGIPDRLCSFTSKSVIGISPANKAAPQDAVVPGQRGFYAMFNCLAVEVRQFICFSPAFIFAHLARGPPKLA